MSDALTKLKNDLKLVTDELMENNFFKENYALIIGCSTSEVMGGKIGKNSSSEAAEVIFNHFKQISDQFHLKLMFQGCEHINRAITMERKHLNHETVVSVVPHKSAGGSLSEYAYHHFEDPVVVEHVDADIGIDMGQTLIGMHLKHVAVPTRTSQSTIGQANVTIAMTRPKLIGGPRAHY